MQDLRRLATRASISSLGWPRHLQAEAHVLAHRHVRVERVGLEHHGHAALGRIDVVYVHAADADQPAGRMSSRPAIMRSSVDLPQPDGPTKTTNSPFGDRQVDAVDDLDVAERFPDISQFKTGHASSHSPACRRSIGLPPAESRLAPEALTCAVRAARHVVHDHARGLANQTGPALERVVADAVGGGGDRDAGKKVRSSEQIGAATQRMPGSCSSRSYALPERRISASSADSASARHERLFGVAVKDDARQRTIEFRLRQAGQRPPCRRRCSRPATRCRSANTCAPSAGFPPCRDRSRRGRAARRDAPSRPSARAGA